MLVWFGLMKLTPQEIVCLFFLSENNFIITAVKLHQIKAYVIRYTVISIYRNFNMYLLCAANTYEVLNNRN